MNISMYRVYPVFQKKNLKTGGKKGMDFKDFFIKKHTNFNALV